MEAEAVRNFSMGPREMDDPTEMLLAMLKPVETEMVVGAPEATCDIWTSLRKSQWAVHGSF